MAERVYINNDWLFADHYGEEMKNLDFTGEGMLPVRLPHTVKELPFHYFDEGLYQMVSTYRKKLFVPKDWADKCVKLCLEGVAHSCEVFINGRTVGTHHCGYTACSFELKEVLRFGEENILTVVVDSREDQNIPPFGYVVDYMTYGGIYRDVYLEITEPEHIEDVFVWTTLTGTLPAECADALLCSSVKISSPGQKGKVRQLIRKWGDKEYQFLGEQEIGAEKELLIQFPVKEAALWEPDSPNLYEISTQLMDPETGEVWDERTVRTGFRKAEFLKEGFYLNGRKFRIRGLNRHQSYPYVGYAMPRSMQRLDAEILKKELGVNAVRTSHYPQSHYFLDRCDELGLLVFTEIPGWQHIGDEAWKEQAIQNVRDMVIQYRNHTSIILWGVRINESQDDDAFYERTNAAAHELDPTRQTGGVRAHKKSSLLEDVYTYNDFVHDGKRMGCEPKKNVTSHPEKPYMITEYNGHMFPTKAYDTEEHRTDHALRHATVLNAVAGEEEIAGSFGWCMADYNTHKDFGSGDRICYHGVLDMFRNPKPAAAVYQSQQEEELVLALSSSMDIGEHPGCNRGNTWIFTNADAVRMYKNDRLVKEYRKEDSPYSHMAHGPLLVDDFVGEALKDEKFSKGQEKGVKQLMNLTARYGVQNLPKSAYLTAAKLVLFYHMNPQEAVGLYNRYVGDWGGASTVYRFEALKDGQIVKSIVKAPMKTVKLKAEVSHQSLKEAESYDVAAVRLRAVDENDNLLPFYSGPVRLHTEGPIALIGGDVITLQGGMGGTYIKTLGESGSAVLTVQTEQTSSLKITFSIEKDS